MVARGWGSGKGECLLIWYGFAFWDNENVLELDSDDGYTILEHTKSY